jgi:hypothetical protein
MKNKIMVFAVLAVLAGLAAGCKDLQNVKVTYKVYTNSYNPTAIPTVSITYTGGNGGQNNATADMSQGGFEYSMATKMGSSINLTASTPPVASDPLLGIISEIWINDAPQYYAQDDAADGILSVTITASARR